MIPLVMLISVLSLAFAVYLARQVLAADQGTSQMQEIAGAIKEGAEAFLRRQNATIFVIGLGVAALIFVLYAFVRPPNPNDPTTPFNMALATTLAFCFGALCSGVSGYVGMFVSIRANLRTASAVRSSLNRALQLALRGGAVSGLFVVAMSLLGVGGLFVVLRAFGVAEEKIPLLIVGYGFGASLVALFAQLGGGIYTKAADVGADLVGKVEAGIPEDDPRNPAVIADLVGDNVGDCAGRGADLFESTAAENIGAMVLGVALFPWFGVLGVLFPLVARGFGVLASIVGVYVVRAGEDEAPMGALNRGYLVTTVLAAVLFGFAAWAMLEPAGVDIDPLMPGVQLASPETWLFYWLCGIAGMVTAFLYVWITQYYTEARYRPVKEIARASETGPATNIISGFSVGLEATWLPVIVVVSALLISYWLGQSTRIPNGGIYGTAIATMGMLSTAAYILAMDTFGPIVDNGAGIIEMSGMSDEARRNMDKLDAAGNTTKALTKGYAVGSAGLAAFLLFNAFLTEANLKSVDLAHPETFVGGFIGAALVFLFTAYAIRAVGRAAWAIIKDVRDQFHEDPGIMAGTSKPDYARSVDIVTRSALKEMIVPGLLAVATPIAVGIFFRFVRVTPGLAAGEPLGATLMVGAIAGVLMALALNTGGGAWDNAKKFIEAGNLAGKGSPTHKAEDVGAIAGDPFNDTAWPARPILVQRRATLSPGLHPPSVPWVPRTHSSSTSPRARITPIRRRPSRRRVGGLSNKSTRAS